MAVVFPLLPQSKLGINRLTTPLGIDDCLAFRAFDKTIIFGHWLSKTHKLALASEAFLLKKGLLPYPSKLFSKEKKSFSKKNSFSKREVLRHFHMGLLPLSSHALSLFFTCKHRVAKFNFCLPTPLFAFHIYLLCFEKVFPLH